MRGLLYIRCLVFVAILIAVFGVLSPPFLSLSNLDAILSASAVIGLLALGSTFVIASAQIDLSIASVMALCGTLAGVLLKDFGVHPLLVLGISLAAGTLCGALNGVLINLTAAPSFIITLGMLSLARALAYIISDGTPVYGLPEIVTLFGQGYLFGVSGPVLIFLSAAIVLYLLLHLTRFGSRVLFVGDNQSAAAAMGVSVPLVRLKVFALSGALSAMAGMVFMARTNCGDPTAGQNYELIAITAVILGGTKLFGGRADIFGTMLGVIALGILQNGLNLLAVSSYYQVLFVGLVLIAAASLGAGEERT